MLEIRKWWPDITNEEIDCLTKYSNYEWLVFRRLISAGIGGGKEISEKDLLQSIPTHECKKMKEAFKSLEQKSILLKKPKTNLTIFQVDPSVYTETIKKFSQMIRENKDLFEALKKENVKFLKISNTLCLLVKQYCRLSYKIEPSLKSTTNNETQIEELGIILTIEFNCPNSYRKNKIKFEIISPEEIFLKKEDWNCDCGFNHACNAIGQILKPNNNFEL
jgi:hypothetical protein